MSERITFGYFDIDGTLKQSKQPMQERMKEALETLPYRGVATQRSIVQAERAVPPLMMNLPSIVLSGSEIWTPEGEVLKTFDINPEARSEIADLMMREREKIDMVRLYPSASRSAFVMTENPETARFFSSYYSDGGVDATIISSPEEMARLVDTTNTSMILFRLRSGGHIVVPPDLAQEVTPWYERATDLAIGGLGVSKGNGILWVCDEYGIDRLKMITAGDNPITDRSMFEHTFGVAVGSNEISGAQHRVSDPADLAEYLIKSRFDQ